MRIRHGVLLSALCLPAVAMGSTGTVDLYRVDPMKHEVLDGERLPVHAEVVRELHVAAARGEYEPASFLIRAGDEQRLDHVVVEWSRFEGPRRLPAEIMDARICKVWWVAHPMVRMGHSDWARQGTPEKYWKPFLTQELLLHDDKLIRVDRDPRNVRNEVRCRDLKTGTDKYYSVSRPEDRLPTDNVAIYDAPTLRPFDIPNGRYKQIWLTIHVPRDAPAGEYGSTITVRSGNQILGKLTLRLTVLPFDLEPTGMHFGLYYRGHFRNYGDYPPGRDLKSRSQYIRELIDMREHGYPHVGLQRDVVAVFEELDEILAIYKKLGLLEDRLLWQRDGFTFASTREHIAETVPRLLTKLRQYTPHAELYFYGRDEAMGRNIAAQLSNWRAIRQAGGKIWASIGVGQFRHTEGLLDMAVLHGGAQVEADTRSGFDQAHRNEIRRYHETGALVLSYAHPFPGQEDAEIYRRNYGLALYKAGYDGAQIWCYQSQGTDKLFNDFVRGNYREMSFTIPVTDGLVPTIGWEGLREGVDDIRYLKTLLKKIEVAKAHGRDVGEYEAWIDRMDPFTGDLTAIRQQMIEKIIKIIELQ